jgi:hypothetical protein
MSKISDLVKLANKLESKIKQADRYDLPPPPTSESATEVLNLIDDAWEKLDAAKQPEWVGDALYTKIEQVQSALVLLFEETKKEIMKAPKS